MATRVRFFVPVNMRGGLFPFGGVGCPMASWVRFFVPANMEGGVCSFLGVRYSQWLHGYDFSYPRVWGVFVLFSEFGLFPMATRVRFFVPANMKGGLFSFGGVGCPMASWVRFFVPMSVWVVGLFLRRGAVWEKNSGYEEVVPTVYKGILFSYSLTSWRRLPSW